MKKGFTLVELLAVIVILAVILVIAIPQVLKVVDNSRKSAYIKNEQMVENVAKTYLASNSGKAPANEGHITIVALSQLQENNLIGQIIDVKDKQTICTGYVLIINLGNNEYDYQPYLNCGENYQTEGYTAESIQEVEVLVVAGGGGSGGYGGGGGGAGGLIFDAGYNVTFFDSISISVGGGGNLRENGENTSFGTLIAVGGGHGGDGNNSSGRNGANGGSGGGGGHSSTVNTVGGIGIVGQGYNGGNQWDTENNTYPAAGGGGAGGTGSDAENNIAGDGGEGVYYGNLFGEEYGENGWFAGGGGGHIWNGVSNGMGGKGGGGTGGVDNDEGNNSNGLTNSGGGAGGCDPRKCNFAPFGGSGIVLIRYPGPQKANGGIVTTFNGYTIHAFTEVGESTFEVLEF